MQQELSPEAYVARYGHDWRAPARAREYVERVDREREQRAEGLLVMTALIPFPRDQAIRVLDVGTGHGLLASMLLDEFPAARAVGLDVSEPMRQIAGERMARYGERFSFVLADFVDGVLPVESHGPFDVAVSSRAIHHVPAIHKQALYRGVYAMLRPGGCFFNLDSVALGEAGLTPVVRDANTRLGARPPAQVRDTPPPGHYYDSVDDHLQFLRQAGFSLVDCFWKRLSLALVGGYKPGD